MSFDLEALRNKVNNMTGNELILAQDAAAQAWNNVMIKRILDTLPESSGTKKSQEALFLLDSGPGMYVTKLSDSTTLETIKAGFEKAKDVRFVGINDQLKKYVCCVTDVVEEENGDPEDSEKRFGMYYLLHTTPTKET